MKKTKKFIALIITVTMLCGINTSYADARDEGTCSHYGNIFDKEKHTYAGKQETINCSYGIPHPCYVMGELVSCQTHYYTMRTPYYCNNCDKFLFYDYTYDMCHQYQHN